MRGSWPHAHSPAGTHRPSCRLSSSHPEMPSPCPPHTPWVKHWPDMGLPHLLVQVRMDCLRWTELKKGVKFVRCFSTEPATFLGLICPPPCLCCHPFLPIYSTPLLTSFQPYIVLSVVVDVLSLLSCGSGHMPLLVFAISGKHVMPLEV